MWYPGRGSSLWGLPLLALGGGIRMVISRSTHVTCVALEIRRIDVLFVGLVSVTVVLDNVRSTCTFVYYIRRSL